MHLKTNLVGPLISAVELKDRVGNDVTAFAMGARMFFRGAQGRGLLTFYYRGTS